MKTLALFDFDGTITKKDTLIDFTRYAFGNLRFAYGIFCLSPFFMRYYLNRQTRDQAARRFIRFFYRHRNADVLEAAAAEYVSVRIPEMINPTVYRAFREHRRQSHDVAIVSASPSLWLAHWCRLHGVGLVATRMEARQGVLTGNIIGQRCIGREKVNRIREHFDLSRFDQVIAYGNSDGDIPMLEMADTAFYFDGRKLQDFSRHRS